MYERLPLLGMVLAAGQIDYRSFQTMVYRTDLITDPDTLAVVDGQLASRAPRWTALSQGKLGLEVDRIVAKADQDAVRRRKERVEDREVVVVDTGEGMAAVCANVFATDGHAFEQRLDALAATVCDADPRTKQQRRADAMGAMAARADRLGCQCGKPDCPAGGKAAAAQVVLHLVADQATVDGTSDKPGYVPSAKLAKFVRCGEHDLRVPSWCPARQCDIDHVVPFRRRSSHACIEFSRSCHREALGMGR